MPKGDRILCVASDPARRAALAEALTAHFEVLAVATANEALAAIRANRPVLAALVDAELRGSSGAQLLAYIRIAAPETARILLARTLDLESAAIAVNEAEVARILVDPVSGAQLMLTLDAVRGQRRAAEQSPAEGRHACTTLLRRLLERTRPLAHARALRVVRLLMGMVDDTRIDESLIEPATLCWEVASIALPPATFDRHFSGQRLTDAETSLVQALPRARGELLAGIAALQQALEIADRATRKFADDPEAPVESRALRLAVDFDHLVQGGLPEPLALDTLHSRGGSYDPELLAAFPRSLGAVRSGSAVRELPLKHVGTGMVFAEDVRTRTGSLLIARGREATANIVRHIRQYPAGQVLEPVRVIVLGPDARANDVETTS